MIVAGAAAYVSTEQAQRNTKEVWIATGTVVEGIHHVPISNLWIATNMKYEGGRGLGRTSWIKQQGRTLEEGLGLPRDIRVFPSILCNIPILLLWFNPFNTQN